MPLQSLYVSCKANFSCSEMCFMRDRHVLYHILMWFWMGGGGGGGGRGESFSIPFVFPIGLSAFKMTKNNDTAII